MSVSYTAIQSWITLLESVYYSYRIKPYSKNIQRSLKKEPKVYLYNWAAVEDPAARFENLVAGHLLKSCHYWTDSAYGEFELHYLRDKEKRELDFLVTKNNSPYLFVEVKSNSNIIQPSTHYFYKHLKPKFAFQVVRTKKVHNKRLGALKEPIQILNIEEFLSGLC